jgi:hypothetical protein
MKKLGLLCLAMVLALGTVGIGYATWSDNVTIEQTVETGSFKVGIRDMGTNDSGVDQWDPGYDKHVARCQSFQVCPSRCQKDDLWYYAGVEERITNAYPSYSCNISYSFANCGTIPAKLKDWETTCTGNLCGCVELTYWKLTFPDGSEFTGTTQATLEPKLAELQIHECQTANLTITKHILQECNEWPPNCVGAECDWADGREAPQGGQAIMVHKAEWRQFNKINEP